MDAEREETMTLCNYGLTTPSLTEWVYVIQSDDLVFASTGRDVLRKAAVRILGPGSEGQWVTLAAANNDKTKNQLWFEKSSQGECLPVLMPSGKSPTQAPGALYAGRVLFVPNSWKNLNTSVLKWTGEKVPGDSFKIRPKPNVRTPRFDSSQLDSSQPDSGGTAPDQKSEKSSVWPYVALGAAGLLAWWALSPSKGQK